MDNTVEIVRACFAKTKKLDKSEVYMNVDLIQTYGLDSLETLKLISLLEVDLEIVLPEEEASNIKTLTDVVRLVQKVQDEHE